MFPLIRFALVRSSAMFPVAQWTFGDNPMLRETFLQERHSRNRPNEQYSLHREGHCSVSDVRKVQCPCSILTYTIQVTMDNGEGMHCGLSFFQTLERWYRPTIVQPIGNVQ